MKHFFSAFRSSVSRVLAVGKKEFFCTAASPAAWVFLILFLILGAFWPLAGGELFSSGQADLSPFFDRMPWLFLLIVPALAMPMWSEERKTGVFELTISFPASVSELVLGKFLAGLWLLGIALVLTSGIPVTAFLLGKPDLGAVIAGYAGAWLLGSVYLAISMFCSALTRSQTASFLLSVLVCGLFLFIGWPQVTDFLSAKLPEALVTELAAFAFLPNCQAFQKGLVDSGEICYAAGLCILFLGLNCAVLKFASAGTGSLTSPGSLRDPAAKRAAGAYLSDFLFFFVFSIAFIIAGTFFKVRFDVSSDRAYSISHAAERLASSLKKPVTLRFYASVSSPAMPEGLRKYADRVQWLLKEFASSSHGMIRLQVIDPVQDSPDEEAALLDSVRPVPLKSGDRIFLGLAAVCGDSVFSVPFLFPAQENLLEYETARAIRAVTRRKKPKIGILSSFPVLGTKRTMRPGEFRKIGEGSSHQESAWFCMVELAKDFDFVQIGEYASTLPGDISALLVIHPVELPTATQQAVDSYLANGGRAAVFLDPQSLYARLKMRQIHAYANKTESSLERFTDAWGIAYRKDRLAADMVRAFRRTLPDRMITNPLALELTNGEISQKDPLFASLQKLSLYYAGVFEITDRLPGIRYDELIFTSEKSQSVPLAGASREQVIRDFRPSGKHLLLGVRLQGKLPRIFPQKGKSSPVRESEIYLFADSDLLCNDLCMTSGTDSFGQTVHFRKGDNVTMLQNVMEKLTSSDELSPVRNRLPMSRPLTKVNELKAAAELRFKERLLKLDREYRESRRRLKELEKNSSRVSAQEKSREIRLCRQKQANLADGIRKLRTELKNELNSMDNMIKLVNLVLIPLSVACAGILLAVFRSLKGRKK